MAFKAYLIEYKTGDIIREETIIGRPKVYQSIDGEHSADLVIKTTKAALDDDYEPYVKGMVIIEGTSLSSSSKVISAGPIDKSFIEAENNTIKIGLASALDYLSKVQIYPYKAVKDSDDAFTIAKGTTDTRAAQKLLRYPWEEGASSDSSDPAPPSHISVSQLSNGSHSTLKEAMKVYYSDGQNVYDAWTELQGIRWGLECAESWSITGSGSSASLRTKLLIYNRFASNKDPLPWKTLPESTMLRYTIEEEPYSITRVIAVSKDSDKDKKIDSDLQHRNKSTGLLLDAFESLSEEATSAEMSDVLSSRLTPEKYSYSTYEIDVFMDGNETDNIGEYLGVRINSGPRRLGSKSRVIGIDHELGSNKYTLEITTAWDARTYPMPSKKKRKDEAKKKKKKRKYRYQKPRKGTNPDYSDWNPGGKYPERPNTGGGTTPTPTPEPDNPDVSDFPDPNDDWNDWDPKPKNELRVNAITTNNSLSVNEGQRVGALVTKRDETTFYTFGSASGTTPPPDTNPWASISDYRRTVMYSTGNFASSRYPMSDRPSSISEIDMAFGSYIIRKITFDKGTGLVSENKKLDGVAVIDSNIVKNLFHSDPYLSSISGDKVSTYWVQFTDMYYSNGKILIGITYEITYDLQSTGSAFEKHSKTKFLSIDVSGDSIGEIKEASIGIVGSLLSYGGDNGLVQISGIGERGMLRSLSGSDLFPFMTDPYNNHAMRESGWSVSGYGWIPSYLDGAYAKAKWGDRLKGDWGIIGYMIPLVDGNLASSVFRLPKSPEPNALWTPRQAFREVASHSGSIRGLFTVGVISGFTLSLSSQKMSMEKPIAVGDTEYLGPIKDSPLDLAFVGAQRGVLVVYDWTNKWMKYDSNTRAFTKIPSSVSTVPNPGRAYSVGNNIIGWSSGNGSMVVQTIQMDSHKPGSDFPNNGGTSEKDLFAYSKSGILTVKTPVIPDGLSVKSTEVLIEDTTDIKNIMSNPWGEKSANSIQLSANGFPAGKKLKVSWNIFASNNKFNQNLAGDEKPAYSVSTTITPQSSGTQQSGSVSVIDNWRNGQGPNS